MGTTWVEYAKFARPNLRTQSIAEEVQKQAPETWPTEGNISDARTGSLTDWLAKGLKGEIPPGAARAACLLPLKKWDIKTVAGLLTGRCPLSYHMEKME